MLVLSRLTCWLIVCIWKLAFSLFRTPVHKVSCLAGMQYWYCLMFGRALERPVLASIVIRCLKLLTSDSMHSCLFSTVSRLPRKTNSKLIKVQRPYHRILVFLHLTTLDHLFVHCSKTKGGCKGQGIVVNVVTVVTVLGRLELVKDLKATAMWSFEQIWVVSTSGHLTFIEILLPGNWITTFTWPSAAVNESFYIC